MFGKLSVRTISWKFPSFEAVLGSKYDAIYLIFLGGGNIMSKIIIFQCTLKSCQLTNVWTSNNLTSVYTKNS